VRASVRAGVWDSVGASVRASVWDSVWATVADNSSYGQHDADWLGFFDYFHEVCGLREQTSKLAGLWLIAQSANWFLPHENICWISERHHILSRDERGRLHNLSGPALAYPDGFSIYAAHGVRVPERVIMSPETLTVSGISHEPNVEVRRVMIERFGAERYLRESGARVAHKDEYGILYRQEFRDDEPLQMVAVQNSTPEPDGSRRMYYLRVPPQITTARAAVAWTFDLASGDYHPMFES
jgi:hypothetical protein